MRCGIDFGTSNTTMAVYDAGTSRLIPLEQNALTIPTALFFAEKNDRILYGRAAIKAYLEGEEGRFMRSLKRVLGTSLMEQTTLINGKRVDFPTIIAAFLRHIKKTAEAQLGQAVTHVTLGRPVHFQDNDPAADQRAQQQLDMVARSVGFETIAFQYEPVAAALAHEKNVVGEKLALVIDIGGGTSDFSVIRLSRDYTRTRDRTQDILANTGVRIGGNDCDKAINMDVIMPHLGLGSRIGDKNLEMPAKIYHDLSEWSKVNWCYTPQMLYQIKGMIREAHEPEKLLRLETAVTDQLGHKMLDVSEGMKITLTTKEKTQQALTFLDHALVAEMTQERMNHVLDTTMVPVRAMMLETLQQAGIKANAIALVVLTGGTTGLPLFQQWLAQHFPRAQVLQDDRLGSVGLGLVL